jgi:hypothetical protein
MNVFEVRYRKVFPRKMKNMASSGIPNWSRSGCLGRIRAGLQAWPSRIAAPNIRKRQFPDRETKDGAGNRYAAAIASKFGSVQRI